MGNLLPPVLPSTAAETPEIQAARNDENRLPTGVCVCFMIIIFASQLWFGGVPLRPQLLHAPGKNVPADNRPGFNEACSCRYVQQLEDSSSDADVVIVQPPAREHSTQPQESGDDNTAGQSARHRPAGAPRNGILRYAKNPSPAMFPIVPSKWLSLVHVLFIWKQ